MQKNLKEQGTPPGQNQLNPYDAALPVFELRDLYVLSQLESLEKKCGGTKANLFSCQSSSEVHNSSITFAERLSATPV